MAATIIGNSSNNITPGPGIVLSTVKYSSTSRILSSNIETDPVFAASDAFNVNNTLINSWNTAVSWGDHSTQGYVTGTPWTSEGYSTVSHADVVVDGDFSSQGLMKRGASSGVYSIVTDNSTDWNTAYGWGDHDGIYVPLTQKGVANGVAELDSSGKVPAAQLPATTDTIVEVANYAALPVTGVAGTIYITLDDGKSFKWGGSIYVEITASLVLGETSTTAYAGDKGKTAYDERGQWTGTSTNLVAATGRTSLGLGNVDNTSDANKPISTAQQTALNLKANIASPTFTGTVTIPSLIVTDLIDGYIPYRVIATDKLGNSPIYSDGTNIGTSTFSSGFAGDGWQLTSSAGEETLTIDNLTVRNKMTINDLIINKIRANNGSLMVSAAAVEILTVTPVSGSVYNCTYDSDNSTILNLFEVNDLIISKKFNGSDVRSYTGRISARATGTFTISDLVGSTPAVGDVVVQAGHTTDTTRQGFIYLTSSETDSPYIDIRGGVNSDTWSGNPKVRLGKLTGISDADFGGALTGYGLYGDNVYLKGGIVATTGSIGDWDITSTYLVKDTGTASTSAGLAPSDYPFYAGQTYASRASAPFRVTKAGVITATSGTIGGFILGSTYLTAGSGSTKIALNTSVGLYLGHDDYFSAPFYVSRAGVVTAKSGTVGGWTLASDAIYTGTKSLVDGYNASGFTLGSDGSLHAPNFYINTDGTIGAKDIVFQSTSSAPGGYYGSIQIEGPELFTEYSNPGKVGNILISMQGPSGGYTNTIIGDGQNNIMFQIAPLQVISAGDLYVASGINFSIRTITTNGTSASNINPTESIVNWNYTTGNGTVYLINPGLSYNDGHIITINNVTTTRTVTIDGNGTSIYAATNTVSSLTLNNRSSTTFIWSATAGVWIQSSVR